MSDDEGNLDESDDNLISLKNELISTKNQYELYKIKVQHLVESLGKDDIEKELEKEGKLREIKRVSFYY